MLELNIHDNVGLKTAPVAQALLRRISEDRIKLECYRFTVALVEKRAALGSDKVSR